MTGSCPMSEKDSAALARAKSLLEQPSFIIKLADMLGKPLDWAIKALPDAMHEKIDSITKKSLEKALDVALKTMNGPSREIPEQEQEGRVMHKLLSAVTGGIGGALGTLGLALDLPITTVIMVRAIADIARQYGEDLSDPETRLQCLLVFALGGSSEQDDSAENSYFATRMALARAVSEAAEYISSRGVAEEGAPALVRLIAAIASRFELAVTEKAAATMIPIIGAAGGATINTMFMHHFQNMATGHFTVRMLERRYGADIVKLCYEHLNSPGNSG